MAAIIYEVKDLFGVEAICAVLFEHGVTIARRPYDAVKVRPSSALTMRDACLAEEIGGVLEVRDRGCRVCDLAGRGFEPRSRMSTERPLDALEMALWVHACPGEHTNGVIQHLGSGSLYTAICHAEGSDMASIGSAGDSHANALAESVIGLNMNECV